MKHLTIDYGYKSYCINGDEDKILRFNPSDPNLLLRAKEFSNMLDNGLKELNNIELNPDGTPVSGDDEDIRMISHVNTVVKDTYNYLFDTDVYTVLFGNQSPFSIVGAGKKVRYLCEEIADAIMPLVETEIAAYQKTVNSKINNYTKNAKQFK